MNTLKHDLKILISILLLSLLLVSCQSYRVESVSQEVVYVEEENKEISSLPLLEKDREIQISDERQTSKINSNKKKYKLALLEYEDTRILEISEEVTFFDPIEYDMPSLTVTLKPKVEKVKVVKKVNTQKKASVPKKATVVKKGNASKIVEVESTNKIKNNEKEQKREIKAKVVKNVIQSKTKTNKNEAIVIDLPEMSVVLGSSFTVEMDQSGWLYESESNYLEFKNKFYTNNRVLFEFVALNEGITNIIFTKYTTGDKEITKIPITIAGELDNKPILQKNIKPEQTISSLSVKEQLENQLKNIDKIDEPDKVYFKLANIYMEEGYIKKSKEFYEYVYDNYPLSQYYDEARTKMEYILDNFLLVR